MPKKKKTTLEDMGEEMPDEIGQKKLPSAPLPYRKEKGGGKVRKGKK